MVTGAFDHRLAPERRTAKRSPPTPAKKASPLRGTVESTVLPTMMFLVASAELDAGAHDDAAAGEALAGVVVGVADQVEGDAPGQEGAEALATRCLPSG